MRFLTGNDYWKWVFVAALTGTVIAAGLSFVMPQTYTSAAVLRMTPGPENSDTLEQIQQEVLSRSSLTELIQRLDLYKKERQREPMEDIVEWMRKHIGIHTVPGTNGAFEVSFAYPDKEKAQTVASAIAARMTQSNAHVARLQELMWKHVEALHSVPMPAAPNLEILNPATVPVNGTQPNRSALVAWGLIAGLLLGLLTGAIKRDRRRTLRLAGFAAAGCAAGTAIAFLLPATYVSRAVMRFRNPIVPAQLLGPLAASPAERFAAVSKQVLSSDSLQNIVESVGLYERERSRQPIDQVLNTMRRHLKIRMLTPNAFSIAFSHSDPRKAQTVVAKLISGFANRNQREEREQWIRAGSPEPAGSLLDRKLGTVLEVLDSGSLPEEPIAPNRWVIAGLGSLAGLIAGAVTLRLRHGPTPSGPIGAVA